MSADGHGTDFLRESVAGFRALKEQAERALAQADDASFFAVLDNESNSLAVIVAHLAGNALSRWTDFLTTDGEKPTRRRDAEFDLDPRLTRADLMARWEAGWRALFAAIEPHTVMQAILRQTRHYACHVGQIVQLAKHYRGADWQTLSLPRAPGQHVRRG